MSLNVLPDHELATKIKNGSHNAYEELYRRYYRLLFVHAYKRLRDEEQAKDIVQDVFITLWDKRDSWSVPESFSGYIFTAVNNRIIDYFLHLKVQDKYLASFNGFLEAEKIRPDHLIREKQLAALIEKEIQQLPPKMREIFELSRKSQLTHKEIAGKLSISEKTVDRQISNALLRLRSKFGLLLLLTFLYKL